MSAPIALALAAGMLAAINPCGFALLPAYVAYFINNDAGTPIDQRVLGAARAAGSMTLGFVSLFVALGVLFHGLLNSVRSRLPWFSIGLGAVLVVAGVLAVAGRQVKMPSLTLRPRAGRHAGAMVSYGIAYALASFSCTVGPFIAVTSFAMDQSLLGGAATYAAYGVGMGTIVFFIGAAGSLLRPRLTNRLRRSARSVPRLAGLFMILGGAYAIVYGQWQLAVYGGNLSTNPVIETGERFRLRVQSLLESVPPSGLVASALLIVLTTEIASHIRAMRRQTHSAEHSDRNASESCVPATTTPSDNATRYREVQNGRPTR